MRNFRSAELDAVQCCDGTEKNASIQKEIRKSLLKSRKDSSALVENDISLNDSAGLEEDNSECSTLNTSARQKRSVTFRDGVNPGDDMAHEQINETNESIIRLRRVIFWHFFLFTI